jgi:TatD DNase family protein
MLVDSHCHLNLCQDLEGVITRAKAAGVKYMQTIATTMEQVEALISIAKAHEGIFVSAGVHPCNVKSRQDIVSINGLLASGNLPEVIGFGETGLDYYHPDYDKKSQRSSFLNHISASSQINLPLIVHTRSAAQDTSDILESEYKNHSFKGLIHCFAQDLAFARKMLDLDFFISISGIITFKNTNELQEVVKYTPLEKMLIETDSPYLAPIPKRGKTNEPAFVKFVAASIAEIKGLAIELVEQRTCDNFFTLFDITSIIK